MPLLDDKEIRELHAAAISASLIHDRDTLLGGIDRAIVAKLPVATSPAMQVMRDLLELNELGVLPGGGPIPLRIWLANAAYLATPRAEEVVFARYRDLVAVRPLKPAPVGTQPAAPPVPAAIESSPSADKPVDFLLFAPLEEERDALLAKLPGHRKVESDGTDVHVYFEAEIQTCRKDGAVYRVVVTSPAGMGPIQAVITASAATARWRPDHVVVVGIAGGLKDEVATGDVMVARSVADYTVGKVREDGSREERWEMYPADTRLLNAANAFREGWTDLVALARPEGTDAPTRHAGVIASGGNVIASKDLISAYRKDMPKLIGVEMEGGGAAAALHGHALRPRFLMVRGVSDLADAEGNAATKKRWRAYARDVAAAYTIGLLRDGPVPAARTRAQQDPR
jgi:nucleoside phosphorylase